MIVWIHYHDNILAAPCNLRLSFKAKAKVRVRGLGTDGDVMVRCKVQHDQCARKKMRMCRGFVCG